jgi:translocation and assembly module TamA
VRGYAYKSLGPLDDEGNIIGGKNLVVHSLEYDYRFGGSNWAAAIFADQGNAFDDDDVIYKRSAGIGLRWLSPIGPIRIDIARALDDERDFRLHLSMGPDL